MHDEVKKSISNIIDERTSSPFYGSLIISWLIWNWKIVYLTVFISDDKISETKIDFIIKNYSDINHVLIFPLISTFVLICFVPFLSNGAFWLSSLFNRWRVNRKNLIERKQLLTLEQSIEIREELKNTIIKYEKLIEDRENSIQTQKQMIIKLNKEPKLDYQEEAEISYLLNHKLRDFAEKIANNETYSRNLGLLFNAIRSGSDPTVNITSEFLDLMESNEIVKFIKPGAYEITENGRKLQKMLTAMRDF